MPRKAVQVDLQEVSLTTRFRKYTGGRRDKVRERAKVEVVQVGEEKYGITIKRGIVTVTKGVVTGPGYTVASIRAAVRRDIRAGKYDKALFDGYDKILEAKKTKKQKK